MLEQEILKTSKRCDIRIVGPNCVGIIKYCTGDISNPGLVLKLLM